MTRGVIISVLASGTVHHGLESRSSICRFSTKLTTLCSKGIHPSGATNIHVDWCFIKLVLK